MSREEELEQLKRYKHLKATERVPADLAVAINTFIEQAVITGEYELDSMPPEYMENLLKTVAKYPEHSLLLMELIRILKENEIIDY